MQVRLKQRLICFHNHLVAVMIFHQSHPNHPRPFSCWHCASSEYAQVAKMLGNGRLEAMCFDGVKRLCHIRGKLRKKVWINQGDIVLVGLREFQDQKADVILKYNDDEARNLKTYGEIPDSVQITEAGTFVGDGMDDDIQFNDVGGDDSDSDDDIDNVSRAAPVSGPERCQLEFEIRTFSLCGAEYYLCWWQIRHSCDSGGQPSRFSPWLYSDLFFFLIRAPFHRPFKFSSSS